MFDHLDRQSKMPELKVNGRPRTFLTQEQIKTINHVFNETKLGPRLLFSELKKRGFKIPKNKMYEYLKMKGLVIPCPAKQKKRKRRRYEWKYSGLMLHGDGHRTSQKFILIACSLWTTLPEK